MRTSTSENGSMNCPNSVRLVFLGPKTENISLTSYYKAMAVLSFICLHAARNRQERNLRLGIHCIGHKKGRIHGYTRCAKHASERGRYRRTKRNATANVKIKTIALRKWNVNTVPESPNQRSRVGRSATTEGYPFRIERLRFVMPKFLPLFPASIQLLKW